MSSPDPLTVEVVISVAVTVIEPAEPGVVDVEASTAPFLRRTPGFELLVPLDPDLPLSEILPVPLVSMVAPFRSMPMKLAATVVGLAFMVRLPLATVRLVPGSK